MNAQEKAKELVDKYEDAIPGSGYEIDDLHPPKKETAKACAIIAVENMEENEMELLRYMTGYMGGYTYREERKNHYQSLKEEIQKL